MPNSVIHYPRLDTVLRVEKVLKDADLAMSKNELIRRLPRKVMHNTLLQILDYLQISGKILFTSKGVIWIYEDSIVRGSIFRRS